jgi:uncharacterized protein YihD (DUF1040 family)
MRDPKRIPEIIQLLSLLWVQAGNTDSRITQLLWSAARAGGWKGGLDLFHCEDDVILEGLKSMLREEGFKL